MHIDHIIPVSKGGTNDLINLVTSCSDCNLGKGATELSDDSIVKKQQKRIKELSDRNEQLEMMLEWRNDLQNIKDKEIEEIKSYIGKKCDHLYSVNENGSKKITRWLRDFSILEILESIDIAFEQYYDGSQNSIQIIFSKTPGICNNRKNGQSKQSYYFHYLKKACNTKYFGNFNVNDLKSIVFRYLKTEEDFNMARIIFAENSQGSQFLRGLREYFECRE